MTDPYDRSEAQLLFTATDRNRGLPGEFHYYRSSSGHIFLGNPPENLEDYYAGGYQKIPQGEEELAEAAKDEAYRLDLLKTLVPKGRFLEIGPWIGLVAYSAKAAGYEVSALEMNPQCVDLLKRVGIDAIRTNDPARTLSESMASYDVVAMWHSIEHLARPWDVVDAAAKALRPGGALLIAAPNPHSAQLRALGKLWFHLDAPRHLHLLPISMIEEIGRRNGLVTVDATTDDKLGKTLSRDAWILEWIRRLRNIPIIRSAMRLPLVEWSERRHRKPGQLDGAGYTVIMKRPLDSGPGLPPGA